MRIPLFIATLFLLSLVVNLHAQDSLPKPIQFTVHAEALARQHWYSINAGVSQPQAIKYRRQVSTQLPITFDTVTDNPFPHGAMYVAVKTLTNYKNKLWLAADLYGEYRGFSYGTFNVKNNIVLFPVVALSAKDTLHIRHANLFADGKLGQFLNERTGEGLMMYNLDVQGMQLRLRYRNSRVGLSIYGDLYGAIGLRIDDYTEFSFEQLSRNDSSRYGLSLTLAAPPDDRDKYHSYFSVYGSISFDNRLRIYSQLGYIPVYHNSFFPAAFNRQLGWVAGIEKTAAPGRFIFQNKTELRYYGQTFNIFHFDPKFRYRDSASNQYEMYANTVGKFLYPLRKFDTPFSQWMVYTEYSGCNIWSLSSTGQIGYWLSKKFLVQADYDLNAIRAVVDKIYFIGPDEKRNSFFIYPFFKSSFEYAFLKEAYVSIFITNKSMNLDLSYPTHYLHNKPFVGIEFYCSI